MAKSKEKEEAAAEPVWGAAATEEPAKEEYKADEPEKTEKEKMLERIQEVLREYSGMESNIPTSHEYWDLCNRYRGL